MKWGRKKSFPFPVSWFSKLKYKGGDNLDSKSKQRCLYNFSTPNSSGWKHGRFYSMDEDDPYWRLSFGEERIQGRRSTGGINNPLWCDDVDHEFQIPVSDFRSFELTEMEVSRRDEFRNFNEMVSDIKRMKERRGKQRVLAEKNGAFGGKNGDGKAGVSTRRRNDVNDRITRKMRGVDDGAEKISILGERDIFPIDNMVYDSRKQRKNTNIDQRSVSGWQDFGDMKLKEIKIKPESKKKSANINRESHSRRPVKASSPRIECKIRALEEMKKARTKSKKKERKEKVLEGNTIFDSFAVVKSSYDPQQDFRDSMVEMIREKGIGHAEDLEELLACYLTLNCDEYHDLIIKVFRQVWLEMEGVCIDPPMQNGAYFDY